MLQEETMLIQALYVLYDERGQVFECNDGRISNMYIEGRDGFEGDRDDKTSR
jgi:hypothetical protein